MLAREPLPTGPKEEHLPVYTETQPNPRRPHARAQQLNEAVCSQTGFYSMAVQRWGKSCGIFVRGPQAHHHSSTCVLPLKGGSKCQWGKLLVVVVERHFGGGTWARKAGGNCHVQHPGRAIFSNRRDLQVPHEWFCFFSIACPVLISPAPLLKHWHEFRKAGEVRMSPDGALCLLAPCGRGRPAGWLPARELSPSSSKVQTVCGRDAREEKLLPVG